MAELKNEDIRSHFDAVCNELRKDSRNKYHTCQHSASIDIEFEKREDLYRILRAKRAKYKKMIGRKEKKEEEKGEKREKERKRGEKKKRREKDM